MMIIKSNEHTLIIPVYRGLHLIHEMNCKYELLECLNSYFALKKKTKCIIMDDDHELINPKDVQFVYISSKEDISSIFDFKPKTLLNSELEKFINENPESYRTSESVRNYLRELLTDEGMYKFMNILGNGISIDLELKTTNFTVSKLLQSLKFETDQMTIQQQFIILYNLLLYVSRNQFTIVYIDFEIDNESMEWLKRIQSPNRIILVSNEAIDDNDAEEFDSMIVLTTNDFVETLEIDKNNANIISYVLHPIVLKHPEYQTEKIIQILSLFEDKSSTFYVEFITDNPLKAFI